MSESSTLSAVAQPAPTWHVGIDRTYLAEAPHLLLLRLADLDIRLMDCSCEACRASDILDLPIPSAEEVAAVLLGNDIDLLEVRVHADLWLPLQGGAPCPALVALQSFAENLAAAGLHVRLIENAGQPPIGTWVRTTGFQLIEADHVVVPDLLGQVADDPFGICTPGISLYVRLVGRDEPYGYQVHTVEALDEAPDDAAIEASRERVRHALALYETECGWTGLLDLGKGRVRTVEEAAKELVHLVDRLDGRSGGHSESDRRGSSRRARRILRAYASAAGSDEAAVLADAPEDETSGWLAAVRELAGRMVAT